MMKTNGDSLQHSLTLDDNLKMDMDLIEILWRQDIDLGVSREMFEMDLWQEPGGEFNKDLAEKKEYEEGGVEKENNQYPQLDLSGNYVVDNETGELVPVTPTTSSADVSDFLGTDASTLTYTYHTTPVEIESNRDEFREVNADLTAYIEKGTDQFNDIREFRATLGEEYISSEDLISQHCSVSDFAAVPYTTLNGIDQSWEDVFSVLNELETRHPGTNVNVPQAAVGQTFNQPQTHSFIPDSSVTFVEHQPQASFHQEPSVLFHQQPVFTYHPEHVNLFARDTFANNITVGDNSMYASLDETMTFNRSHNQMLSPSSFVPDMSIYNYQPMNAANALVQNVSAAPAIPAVMEESSVIDNWSSFQTLPQFTVASLDNQTYTSLLSPSFNLSQNLSGINLSTVNLLYQTSVIDHTSSKHETFTAAAEAGRLAKVGQGSDLGQTITASISYANNDSYIQEILQNDLNDLEFDDNFDEDQSGLELTGLENEWSADPAVYSTVSTESFNKLQSSYQDILVAEEMDEVDDEMTGATSEEEGMKYSAELYQPFNTTNNSALTFNSVMMGINTFCSSNDVHQNVEGIYPKQVSHNKQYHTQSAQRAREEKEAEIKQEKEDKAARSRDTKRAKTLKLPFSIDDIIYLPVDEFTEMLTRYTLTEAQHQLVRDIRRRGKNKAAAQNCRKRKLEIIQSLDDEVEGLRRQRDHLSHTKRSLDGQMSQLREKFTHLEADLLKSLRDASGRPYDPNEYSLQRTSDGDIILMPRNPVVVKHDMFASVERSDDFEKDGADKKPKQKNKE